MLLIAPNSALGLRKRGQLRVAQKRRTTQRKKCPPEGLVDSQSLGLAREGRPGTRNSSPPGLRSCEATRIPIPKKRASIWCRESTASKNQPEKKLNTHGTAVAMDGQTVGAHRPARKSRIITWEVDSRVRIISEHCICAKWMSVLCRVGAFMRVRAIEAKAQQADPSSSVLQKAWPSTRGRDPENNWLHHDEHRGSVL